MREIDPEFSAVRDRLSDFLETEDLGYPKSFIMRGIDVHFERYYDAIHFFLRVDSPVPWGDMEITTSMAPKHYQPGTRIPVVNHADGSVSLEVASYEKGYFKEGMEDYLTVVRIPFPDLDASPFGVDRGVITTHDENSGIAGTFWNPETKECLLFWGLRVLDLLNGNQNLN